MKKKKTIQVPNFKESGIGFTTAPTCVMENPHQWGLDGNSFRLWAYLISRIKKEQFFNGSTIKTQLKGTMGETAVSKGLKKLCDLGFCTKRPNRNTEGQLAGYSYTFYAIPKRKAQVAKVVPEICEKLEASGWFDLPDDGKPYRGVEPHHGNPADGEAPSKEKDEIKGKDKNKEKTPNPLSRKEGDAGAFSREDSYSSEHPEVEVCGEEECAVGFRPGRWYRTLKENPVGSRLLEMLQPEQIPNDMALRSMAGKIRKGQITPAYLTFIHDRIIRPNRIGHESKGSPLYSLPEIQSKMQSEASMSGESFSIWKKMKFENLHYLWKKGSQEFDKEAFETQLNTLAAEQYPDEYCFQPDELLPDENCFPYRLLVYLKRCQSGDHSSTSYAEHELIQIFHNGSIWTHLLDQGAENREQFHSLELLCQMIHEKLPRTAHSDMEELRANYSDLNQKKMAELEEKFAELGAKPPAIQSAE